MSERIKGFIVSLEKDLHEDDARAISDAILRLRGVLDVASSISDPSDWINRSQTARYYEIKIIEAMRKIREKED